MLDTRFAATPSDTRFAAPPSASRGCARGWTLPQHWPTIVSGGIIDLHLSTQRRPFRLSLPATYGALGTAPPPLLLHFHGWGGTLESGQMFHAHGVRNGYLVASPLGFDDEGTQPASWNGAGTSTSPGPAGHTCHDPSKAYANLCYRRSCGECRNDTCGWATCEDSVAQTERLLDELEATLCYDPRRVYATGVSNGGMFLYELAASRVATAFAAYMPIVGSPHRGYNRPHVAGPTPFFGIWGRADTTVPPMANPEARGHPGDADVSLDTRWSGWYFATASATVRTWARTNGCAGEMPTADGCNASMACALSMAAGAACVGYRAGCEGGARVVQCLHGNGHEVPGWAPDALWAFMLDHPERIADPPQPPPRDAWRIGLLVDEWQGSDGSTTSHTAIVLAASAGLAAGLTAGLAIAALLVCSHRCHAGRGRRADKA